MQCVVLAGGLATRLRPASLTVPKALVPVRGVPFIDYQLRWLADEGVDDVVLCIAHLGAEIRDHVGDGNSYGVKVRYVDEGAELRGTGGALRLAVDSGVLEERFLVLYGDSYLRVPFRDVMASLDEAGVDGVMTVFPAGAGGLESPNAAFDGRWVRYDKRGAGRAEFDHVDYGVLALRRRVVEDRIPAGAVADLADLLADVSAAGALAGVVAHQRYFEVGSFEGIRELEAHLGGHDDWDGHWDSYAESAERNPAEQYRRRLVFRVLDLGVAPAQVLDVGAGQGDLATEVLNQHPAADVLGLELSRTGVELARQKAPRGTFLQRDLMQSSEVEAQWRGWATHAICSEVLEHVDHPEVLLREARAYMAPGCRLVITVPGGPMSAFDRHIGHRRHFTPGLLREVLEAAGFEVDWIKAAGFPFFDLYRLTVLARGEKLIDDVAEQGGGQAASWPARTVMALFRPLFRLNISDTRWGWQLLASALNPS